jgi:hypothetical protein
MSQIRMHNGGVLIRSGAVACGPNCCCASCDCGPWYDSDDCEKCITHAYAEDSQDWLPYQIELSGVVQGSEPHGFLCVQPPCDPPPFAANLAFFNRTLVVPRCFIYNETYCLELPCYDGEDSNIRWVESGSVFIDTTATVGCDLGTRRNCGIIRLRSRIERRVDNCSGAFVSTAAEGRWDAFFGRPVAEDDFVERYRFNPATCPPASCFNPIDETPRCLPANTAIPVYQAGSTNPTSCRFALNFDAANAIVQTV